MYVYTIEDFGSSGFKEPTVLFQCITIIVLAMNYSWPPKIVDRGVTKISLPPTPLPP